MKIAVGNGCLLRGKKMIKFFKVLGQGLCLTHVGAPCCETWLEFGFEVLRCKKKMKKEIFGSLVTPLVGRHVVN